MGSNTYRAIYLALLIAPYPAIIGIIPYIIYEYRNKKLVFIRKSLNIYLMLLFFLCAYFMTMLPFPDIEYVRTMDRPYFQLIPFMVIHDYFKDSGLVISDATTYLPSFWSGAFLGPVLNVVMLMPLGYFFRESLHFDWKKTALAGFLVSLLFEITQLTGLFFIYPRPYRIFDVDDLIGNTLGALIGYMLLPLVHKYSPIRRVFGVRILKQGGGVSLRRRLPAIVLDQLIAFVLTAFMGIFFHWDILKGFFLYVAAYLFWNTVMGLVLFFVHSTPGFSMTGLRLRSVDQKPLKLWQCVGYLWILAGTFLLPFGMYYCLTMCIRLERLRYKVFFVSGNVVMMLMYIYLVFTFMLNGITHGTTMYFDRFCKTYVGLSKEARETDRMRVLMNSPLDAECIANFSEKIKSFLTSHGYDENAALRTTVMADSAMKDWINLGMEGKTCELRFDSRFWRKTLFVILYTGQRLPKAPKGESNVEMAYRARVSYEQYFLKNATIIAIDIP